MLLANLFPGIVNDPLTAICDIEVFDTDYEELLANLVTTSEQLAQSSNSYSDLGIEDLEIFSPEYAELLANFDEVVEEFSDADDNFCTASWEYEWTNFQNSGFNLQFA